MTELFQKSRSTINEHILHIYEEKDLPPETSMSKIGISAFSTHQLYLKHNIAVEAACFTAIQPVCKEFIELAFLP